MGSLTNTLLTATSALRTFERAFAVIQNNVSNAATSGFASQRLILEAHPFEMSQGMGGGVRDRGINSARNEYTEQAVRRRQHIFGQVDEMASELSRIEGLFDISGEAGIPAAINALFKSFSALSVTPNDSVARREVIESARDLALRINENADAVITASANVGISITNAIDAINSIATRLREFNVEYRRDIRNLSDPGLDAKVQTAMEELAEYVDFTALRNPDGSYEVLIGGEVPLVVADRQYLINADCVPAQAVIYDANGADITSRIRGGRLSALLEVRNETLISVTTGLHRLAAQLADTVNTTLAAGVDSTGQPGAPLFAYNAAEDAAQTIHITPITPFELAAALLTAPGGNGNALNLAALADAAAIDGFPFVGFYGNIARSLGRALANATEQRDAQEALLVQARALRSEVSGVELDEEAVRLMEFQRAYQASARMISIVSEMLDTVLEIGRR